MADQTFIKGRGQRTALLLLTAAAQLEQPKQVVRAQLGGYMVPDDVAERYEVLKAELAEDEAKAADAVEDAEPEKPTRRTAAKKTAAKTTQAKE
jgi:hypothetical protein